MNWFESHVDGVLEGFYFGTEPEARRLEILIPREGHICALTPMTAADIERHNQTPGRLVLSPNKFGSNGNIVVIGADGNPLPSSGVWDDDEDSGVLDPDRYYEAADAIDMLDDGTKIIEDDDPILTARRQNHVDRLLAELRSRCLCER